MSKHLDPGMIGPKINRHSLHSTSTGKGHDFTHGFYFPPSLYRRSLKDVMPPPNNLFDHVTRRNEVMTGYETTNQILHNHKNFGSPPLRSVQYKKAPACYNVHYLRDTYEKLQSTDSRRVPLTTGYQSSETFNKHNYKDGRAYQIDYPFDVQPYNLSQHHVAGPSQQVIGSTQNPAVQGQEYFVCDQGTFRMNDAYLTTDMQTHRKFTRQELLGHAKKDNATYWECENYPKAWGHGSKVNPLIDDTRILRRQLPMRDLPAFKSVTTVPYLPNIKPNVPHSGMKTLKQDSYRWPAHLGHKENLYCPVDSPYINPVAGPKEIMTIPKMYKSEYTTYGSGRPITVN